MSAVTIFDSVTGKHIRTGNRNDPKTADLVAAGHIDIDGSYSSQYMYDIPTSTVILDTQKEQDASDRQQRKSDLSARRVAHLSTLKPTVGNNRALPEVNAAIDMLIEYMEKI